MLGVSVLICAHYGIFSWLVVNVEAELLPSGSDSLVCLPQGLQAKIMTGQQRLQALLCQAVHSSQEATEQEK